MPFDQGEQHLGVRRAAEADAGVFQFAAQLGKIIDLAIVGHDIAPARRGHGLVTRLPEIDDREASVGEADPVFRIDPDPIAIRPAMGDRQSHGVGDPLQRGFTFDARTRPEPGNATHYGLPAVSGIMTC